jgi:hypothetical protein
VGLERGPLSLVSTAQELLGRKSSDFCLENENTAVGILRSDHATSSNRKFVTNFGIVHSWTKAKKFVFFFSQLTCKTCGFLAAKMLIISCTYS